MISHLNSLELGAIAARGGSLEVDGSCYNSLELGSIAARLAGGATLRIHNSSSLNSLEMGAVAARKPGQVIFC